MILIATEGSGSHLIDFKTYKITKGTVSLMYPGMIHAWEEDNDLKGYLIFFTASFFSLRYHDHELSQFPFFTTSHISPIIQLSKIDLIPSVEIFDKMFQEYESTRPDYLRVLRSYLNIFLIHCKRYYEKKSTPNSSEDNYSLTLLKKFEQTVEENFKEKRLVKEYAKLLNITPNYLNGFCKKSKGMTAGDIIRNRVMLESRRLLIHDDRTISGIASELGFDDAAYFSRFFKKYEKLSPEQFRKKYLSEIY